MAKKMYVLEARRLLPLLFLLVLLVSLSLYDTFRVSPAAAPDRSGQATEVGFNTADKGQRAENPTFRLADNAEGWAAVADEWNISLPQYPFQPHYEVALFALHAEVQNVKAITPAEGSLVVEVRVNPRRDYFQVVTLPVSNVVHAGGETVWRFVDRRGNVLEQFTAGAAKDAMTEDIIPEK